MMLNEDPLETKLLELGRKLMLVQCQSIIRTEVLSQGELEKIRDQHYSGMELKSDEFKSSFDSNGRLNLCELAKIRKLGDLEIVLAMALEVGLISEARFSQCMRTLSSAPVSRQSVHLHYDAGKLWLNGKFVGKVEERSCGTRKQVILQMFQDQNWPSKIVAPSSWDAAKVKNTCQRLRNEFKHHLGFHESSGGSEIQFEILAPQLK